MARFSLLSRAQSSKPEADHAAEEPISTGDAPEETVSAQFGADDAEDVALAEEDAPSYDLLDAKLRVHNKLIDELDLSMLDKLDEAEMRRQVSRFVSEIVRDERLPMNQAEVSDFADSVYHEMTGLGPLEPLLADPSISDILINGYNQVYVERGGELELSTAKFRDNAHLRRIVSRIVSAVGRRVDESQPLVDARLLDGSRVNAAVEPVAIDGPLVSIRKFSKKPLTLEKLIGFGAMPKEVAEFLFNAVKCRVTCIISGGTGSGKTTLLNALSKAISHKERLITIEDAAELQLQQPHVARMETRPPNLEGKGEIRQRELVKNALRMRPDRVILGEVRSEEAFDMLQAMNTGHDGSLTTVHSNTPRDCMSRLETLVQYAGAGISPKAIKEMIASAVHMVVQQSRLEDGSRKIMNITEVGGLQGEVITLQDIFVYKQEGMSKQGKIIGKFMATGFIPKFIESLEKKGYKVPRGLFKND